MSILTALTCIYNKVKDTFQLQVNLMNVLGGSVMLNDLLVDDKGCFWMALDRGVYRMDPPSIAGSKDITAPDSPNKGKYSLKNTYVNHIVTIPSTPYFIKPSLFRTLQFKTTKSSKNV